MHRRRGDQPRQTAIDLFRQGDIRMLEDQDRQLDNRIEHDGERRDTEGQYCRSEKGRP